MTIPVDATKAQKQAFVKTIRKTAHGDLHHALNTSSIGERYQGFGHDTGHKAIGRLIAKTVHAWKQARNAAGLGKP